MNSYKNKRKLSEQLCNLSMVTDLLYQPKKYYKSEQTIFLLPSPLKNTLNPLNFHFCYNLNINISSPKLHSHLYSFKYINQNYSPPFVYITDFNAVLTVK